MKVMVKEKKVKVKKEEWKVVKKVVEGDVFVMVESDGDF